MPFCKIVQAAGGGASYDLTETFEGSAGPGSGYDNAGWVESTSAVDPDYTTSPAPLEGSESLYHGNASRNIYHAITPADSHYAYFMMQSTNDPGSEQLTIGFYDSVGTTWVARVFADYFAAWRIYQGTANTNGGAWAVSTTYHIWFEYTIDSGATDGQADLYVATTDTKPGAATVSMSNGNYGSQADRVYFQGGTDAVFDKIIIDSSPIGSSPSI